MSKMIYKPSKLDQTDLVFTALHTVYSGISHDEAVRPSVCLSDKRVNWYKTKETSVTILTPQKRTIRTNSWWETTPCT